MKEAGGDKRGAGEGWGGKIKIFCGGASELSNDKTETQLRTCPDWVPLDKTYVGMFDNGRVARFVGKNLPKGVNECSSKTTHIVVKSHQHGCHLQNIL